MKTSYDILKPTKSGSINLSKKWLQEHLDMGSQDMVLMAYKETGGHKQIVLTKFDPAQHFRDQVAPISGQTEDPSEEGASPTQKEGRVGGPALSQETGEDDSEFHPGDKTAWHGENGN